MNILIKNINVLYDTQIKKVHFTIIIHFILIILLYYKNEICYYISKYIDKGGTDVQIF